MNSFSLIHQSLRCCMHCGSPQCGDSLFCRRCEADLWKAHAHLRQFQLGRHAAKGLALFDWYPDQDRKVSKLMLALKGGRLTEAFDFYAQAFVGRLPNAPPKNSVLVPCPSSRGRKHAQILAREISEILGLPIVDSLIKADGRDQKSKNSLDRADIDIRNTVDFKRQHVIFIDDIVTTGATALSARNAIGSCRSFQIWCLAHRQQLATIFSF